jgi:S-adenosylmethionine decarboxylase
MAAAAFGLGLEHVVDAYGCDEAALRSQIVLQRLLSRIIEDLHLRVIGDPAWHVFPEPAGLTGLVMLTESHLSVHTFPESQYAAMNLYCCRQTAEWSWQASIKEILGARDVVVRTIRRGVSLPVEAL